MLYLPLAIVICTLAAAPTTQPDSAPAQPSRAALEQRIAELEAKVRLLEEALEPTQPPINLARTSLAEVAASSVNGSRTLNNKFYGVRNAFDGGENWINNINYTYWLASGGSNWIEVYFKKPVTIRAASIEGPSATVRLFGANGGEFDAVQVTNRTDFAKPIRGVVRVKFDFSHGRGGGNTRVNEIKLLGDPPPNTEFEVKTPNIRMTDRGAIAMATEQFQNWRRQIFNYASPQLKETDTAWTVTFARGGTPYYRVTIDKVDQSIEETPLVTLEPISQEPTE